MRQRPRRPRTKGARTAARASFGAIVILCVAAIVGLLVWGGGRRQAPAAASPRTTPATVADPATVALARQKIKHVVFVIKENRTFDTLFGTFPGADGATQGATCSGGSSQLAKPGA